MASKFEYLCKKIVKSLPTHAEVSEVVVWVTQPHLLQEIVVFSLPPAVLKDRLNPHPPFLRCLLANKRIRSHSFSLLELLELLWQELELVSIVFRGHRSNAVTTCASTRQTNTQMLYFRNFVNHEQCFVATMRWYTLQGLSVKLWTCLYSSSPFSNLHP